MPDEFGEHVTRVQRPFLHTESLGFKDSRIQVRQGTGMAMQKLHFVLSDTLMLFWIVVLIDPTTAHYEISSRGHQGFFF